MGLQSGLLHLILKCDAQQKEQRTQNTHAAQRGLGELAVPLFIIRGGLPNVYGTACAAALRGITPEFCVQEAMHGMMHRRTIIVPSAFMRACTTAQKLLPASLLMPIVARQQKKKLG